MSDPERNEPAATEEPTADETQGALTETVGETATEASDSTSGGRQEPRGSRTGPLIAVLALLLAAAAWIAGFVLWQQADGTHAAQSAEAQRDRAALGERLDGDLRSVAARSAELLEVVTGQQAALVRQQGELERQRQSLQEAYDALQAQIGQDSNGWILAEAEYLIRAANHRLQLARDVPAAIAALAAADRRLETLADPALLPVRAQLADEIAALRAVPGVDVEGLALKLLSLAKRTEGMPVLGSRYAAATAGSSGTGLLDAARDSENWEAAATAVWSEVRGLVEIRRNDAPVRPLLAPEHEYFLHLNLRLQLDAARLALLRGTPPLYTQSVSAAREWTVTYFDTEDAAIQALLNELDGLLAVDIRPQLPEISGSLRALHELSASRADRPAS